jgi:hypothetical protein
MGRRRLLDTKTDWPTDVGRNIRLIVLVVGQSTDGKKVIMAAENIVELSRRQRQGKTEHVL